MKVKAKVNGAARQRMENKGYPHEDALHDAAYRDLSFGFLHPRPRCERGSHYTVCRAVRYVGIPQPALRRRFR